MRAYIRSERCTPIVVPIEVRRRYDETKGNSWDFIDITLGEGRNEELFVIDVRQLPFNGEIVIEPEDF